MRDTSEEPFSVAIKADGQMAPADRRGYIESMIPVVEGLSGLDSLIAGLHEASEALLAEVTTEAGVQISTWMQLMQAQAALRDSLSSQLEDEIMHLVGVHFVSGRQAAEAANLPPATVNRMIRRRREAGTDR